MNGRRNSIRIVGSLNSSFIEFSPVHPFIRFATHV